MHEFSSFVIVICDPGLWAAFSQENGHRFSHYLYTIPGWRITATYLRRFSSFYIISSRLGPFTSPFSWTWALLVEQFLLYISNNLILKVGRDFFKIILWKSIYPHTLARYHEDLIQSPAFVSFLIENKGYPGRALRTP